MLRLPRAHFKLHLDSLGVIACVDGCISPAILVTILFEIRQISVKMLIRLFTTVAGLAVVSGLCPMSGTLPDRHPRVLGGKTLQDAPGYQGTAKMLTRYADRIAGLKYGNEPAFMS